MKVSCITALKVVICGFLWKPIFSNLKTTCMEQPYFDNTTKEGTATGTLLTIFVDINSEDLVKTAVLAGVDAMVSFTATLLLKVVARHLKNSLSIKYP
jgi:hypothetical protein